MGPPARYLGLPCNIHREHATVTPQLNPHPYPTPGAPCRGPGAHLGVQRQLRRPPFAVAEGQPVHVLLRPEDIRVLAPDDDHGLAGKIVERNYKGSTLDSVIHLEDGTEVLASEFFDEDDPMFDYRLGEPVKVSWVDGWEWLLPEEAGEIADKELSADA